MGIVLGQLDASAVLRHFRVLVHPIGIAQIAAAINVQHVDSSERDAHVGKAERTLSIADNPALGLAMTLHIEGYDGIVGEKERNLRPFHELIDVGGLFDGKCTAGTYTSMHCR